MLSANKLCMLISINIGPAGFDAVGCVTVRYQPV